MMKSTSRLSTLLFFVFACSCSLAQQTATPAASGRTRISMNNGWMFAKAVAGSTDTSGLSWQPVSLPHSWNTTDVMDDEPSYYRGVGWYKRKLVLPADAPSRQYSLYLEGANQLTDVYVNGKKMVTHTGGYNGFYVPLNDAAINKNLPINIVISVDNSFNENIAPLTADFTFFGGLYRDAWLITTNDCHFDLADHGSAGVFVSTPEVSAAKATIAVSSAVENTSDAKRKLRIISIIRDHSGTEILRETNDLQLAPGARATVNQLLKNFSNPHLWSPDDPYLYTVQTMITDVPSRQIVDELTSPLGFRWFRFDADSGFYLNGKSLKLVGASRHQDRPYIGNAVPDDLAREDIRLLKEMGGNFLRVAHYPQDQSILEECDRIGILASVEIPVVNEITESEEFSRNCESMQLEMIRQNFNHPAIIIWCYMNEIMLKPHFNNDKPRQEIYFRNIVQLASRLDSLTRKEDPSRYTMIANHGDFDRYNNTGLTKIPMIVGWNLYSGWYGGKMEDFPKFLEKHHAKLPGKPLIVSEYGADADPRIHSFTPARFDKSVEYSLAFHQSYLQEMLSRPYCAAAVIWNLADFNSETREETMPHINNKGMLRWDRTPKELYYFYQSILLKKPFVKIASRNWQVRTGIADSTSGMAHQPIQVATNADSVELVVGGRNYGFRSPVNGLCTWQVGFADGRNLVEAVAHEDGGQPADRAVIDFTLQPYLLPGSLFKPLHVLLGARRYYIDEKRSVAWMPDQPYRPGSWGSIGGQPFNQSGNGRLPYGSDKDIRGTSDDPVYQTQQTGISGYRLDVPDGEYELTLHFAELAGVAGSNLVYNLSGPSTQTKSLKRIFHVEVNGMTILRNLDIAGEAGTATALVRQFRVPARNGTGINIRFIPVEGEPVLNALEVRAVY